MTERWTDILVGALLGLAGLLVLAVSALELDPLRAVVGVCLLLSGVLRIWPPKRKKAEGPPCQK